MKSSQVVSCVSVEFVSNISEAVSVSTIRGDVMQTETASEMLDTNSTLTWLSTQEDLIVYCHHENLKPYIDLILLSGDNKTTLFTLQSHLPCSNQSTAQYNHKCSYNQLQNEISVALRT
jgi:hypothetical protein